MLADKHLAKFFHAIFIVIIEPFKVIFELLDIGIFLQVFPFKTLSKL
jgi:hypothetical protein